MTPSIPVFLGTYTTGWSCEDTPCESQGIYRSQFDPATGALSKAELLFRTDNPSYLALSADGQVLYAVSEVGDFKSDFKGSTGGVLALSIADDRTALINQVPSRGNSPCYISLSNSGAFVLVANYVSGNVTSLPVAKEGELGNGYSVQHTGKGEHPRQEGPHAHFIAQDPKGDVYVADLGIDQVVRYKLDEATGKLKSDAAGRVPAGSGPRHLVFHPNGRYLYANNELSATVTLFERESMKALQTLSTLPDDFKGGRSTAAMRISADGRFLYVSNRGHDSITVFAVDETSGKLTARAHTSTGGKWPREFQLSPDGKYLLAANKKSGNVVVFAVDGDQGTLKATGQELSISQPVAIAFGRP